MANKVMIDFSELKALQKDIVLLSKPEKNRAIKQGFKKGADMLRDEIKAKAPVDQGTLKKDIRSSATTKGSTVYILGGRLSPQKANWLEYGTSKMSPKPFIRPVFDAKQSQAEKLCITGIISAIDEAFTK